MQDQHTNGAHNDLYEKVGRIEGKLGGIDDKLVNLLVAFTDHREDMSDRVGAVEKDLSRAKGIAGVIGAIMGFVAANIKSWLHL